MPEGESRTYRIVLSSQPAGEVEVAIGGTAGTDLSLSATPLIFTTSNWNTAQTVTVTAEQDGDAADDTTTITHTVSSTDDAEYDGVSAGSVSVTVTDDDSVGVTISETSLDIEEGDSATYTVSLDSEPTGSVTVNAPANTDVTAEPASLIFTVDDWDTPQEVTVAVAQDGDAEDDDGESVKLGFGAMPAGVSSGTPNETVVSITDDDVPTVSVSFEQATYTAAEGSNVTVKVILDADPGRTVTIPITKANQDGASDSDYSIVPSSVVFASGDTEQTITFAATADDVDDDGESVKLGFGTMPTGVTASGTTEATVSITDDDAIALPLTAVQVSFGGSTFAVAEGSSVEVTINLSADPERTVTIPLTTTLLDGASAADYSGVPASVTFNSGDTQKTFTFSATQDSVQDAGESVRLTFGSLPDGVTAASPAETSFSITDDEVVMEVSFERSEYSVNEGHGVEVMVKLDHAPDHPMDIRLQKTNMNGAGDGDYSGIPSMLTFERGETEKRFTFFAEPDDESDDGETVMVNFGALPAMVQKGDPSEATMN